jgi:predicted nucleic acid-binding protein
MPNVSTKRIVINTSPLLALIAGLNSLDILHEMYDEVIVPNEVKVTGSLGIIIKAIKKGKKLDFWDIVNNMRSKNIFLSDRLIKNASAILNSK